MNVDFAERLSTALERRGWRRADLARRSGLSSNQIAAYLQGRAKPRPDKLLALAHALGCPVSELDPSASPLAQQGPTLAIVPAGGGKCRLVFDQVVTPEVAIEVARLLAPVLSPESFATIMDPP